MLKETELTLHCVLRSAIDQFRYTRQEIISFSLEWSKLEYFFSSPSGMMLVHRGMFSQETTLINSRQNIFKKRSWAKGNELF